MSKRRLLVATAAAVSTAAALLGGGLTARGTAPAVRPKAAPQTDQLAAGFAAGNTQALVAQLQAGLRARPENVRGLDLLGLAYQQRARETGDPSYYVKSDGVLRRARCGSRRTISTRRAGWPRSRSRVIASPWRSHSGAARSRSRPRPPATTASSATRSSSSAGTGRRSPRSTRWRVSSRASRRTPASRTHASCSARSTPPAPRSCSPATRPPTSASRSPGRRPSSASSSCHAAAWTPLPHICWLRSAPSPATCTRSTPVRRLSSPAAI